MLPVIYVACEAMKFDEGKEAVAQPLITEIFPVKTEEIPQLYGYKLDVTGGDLSTIGGKLSYRLKRNFPGHWAWADKRIITDTPVDQSEIMEIVKTLWTEQPQTFRGLRNITEDLDWQPTAQGLSEFVSRGLLSEAQEEIRRKLSSLSHDLGNAYVERICEIRGWVVHGEPAVSVSLSSRLLYKKSLVAYIAEAGELEVEGLEVADKTSTLKGTIVGIVGPVASERERLLAVTQREEMQALIAKAPDDELVVKVSPGYGQPYDYIASALRIVLRMDYLDRFGVNGKKAIEALRIAPHKRAKMIADISKVVQQKYVGRAFNSKEHTPWFSATPYSNQVRVGGGKTILYNDRILRQLQRYGLYKMAAEFKDGRPIRVGFINALGRTAHDNFWNRIASNLLSLGYGVESAGVVNISSASRAELEAAVSRLQDEAPHVVLAFFPTGFSDEDSDETAYYHFKSLTVGRGLPSQVVEQRTLDNTHADGNIVLGILGKTGNIPYVLAEPLDFADVVVGLDIARDRKKRLPGSINATAIARIYLNNGEFLQYVIHDAPLEGETIPQSVLQGFFPSEEFAGKRVIIHRDGYFRGNERKALLNWAQQIGATFYLVQVIKSGAPRIYGYENQRSVQPIKGSTFLLSDNEALLVSSLPPFKDATPMPLRITADQPFTIDQALQSVLAMTTMHYGSLRPPRLPVTIHYSDKIAYMALRGIKPQNLSGNVPYWL